MYKLSDFTPAQIEQWLLQAKEVDDTTATLLWQVRNMSDVTVYYADNMQMACIYIQTEMAAYSEAGIVPPALRLVRIQEKSFGVFNVPIR